MLNTRKARSEQDGAGWRRVTSSRLGFLGLEQGFQGFPVTSSYRLRLLLEPRLPLACEMGFRLFCILFVLLNAGERRNDKRAERERSKARSRKHTNATTSSLRGEYIAACPGIGKVVALLFLFMCASIGIRYRPSSFLANELPS